MSEALQQPPNADKEPYISLKKLTRDQTAALQEATIDTFVEGRGDERSRA